MIRRTPTTLRAPENGQSYTTLTVPEPVALQINAKSSDLIKVEENTQLHIAAMDAHDEKGKLWIEINVGVVEKSSDAFSGFLLSSEERMTSVKGTMFEKETVVAENYFQQSLIDGLGGNIQLTQTVTAKLSAMSVLPKEDPQMGFWQRLGWVLGGD
jgi:hypothetical protein